LVVVDGVWAIVGFFDGFEGARLVVAVTFVSLCVVFLRELFLQIDNNLLELEILIGEGRVERDEVLNGDRE
jgi:hypothetical protein